MERLMLSLSALCWGGAAFVAKTGARDDSKEYQTLDRESILRINSILQS